MPPLMRTRPAVVGKAPFKAGRAPLVNAKVPLPLSCTPPVTPRNQTPPVVSPLPTLVSPV